MDTDTELDLFNPIALHKAVRASGSYNFEKCRIELTSQLRVEKCRELLRDYEDSDVADYVAFGWPINFTGSPPSQSDIRNHAGARNFAAYVDKYLKREVELGRIAGPFAEAPFSPFYVSPLNTVPKADSLDRRVIVDLSWPIGSSVNDGIDKEFYLGEVFEINFPTVDDIVSSILRCGKGCFIYKRDLKNAYRQFRVDPRDYKYLGYFWNGLFYFDTVLCMGQRTAGLACQRTTRAVVYIHNANGHPCIVY